MNSKSREEAEGASPRALSAKGAELLKQGRLDEGAQLIAEAYGRAPDDAETVTNFAILQQLRGAPAAAEQLFVAAIKLNPLGTAAHLHLGNLFRDTKRHALAERAYHHVLRRKPDDAAAWMELGLLYTLQLKEEPARTAYARAVASAPGMAAAHLRLLDLLEKSSRMDGLEKAVTAARNAFPENAEVAVYAARLLRRQEKNDEALALLERHANDAPKDDPKRANLFFELGQLYDRADDAPRAFAAFTTANRLQGMATAADKTLITNMAARLHRDFTPAMGQGAAPQDKRPVPVFMVGFPRSGTTMLDNILSSHPRIAVAEEKPGVFAMSRKFAEIAGTAAQSTGPWDDPAFPARLATLTENDIARLRDAYFAAQADAAQDKNKIFIDKLPLNMLQAGFIHRVFPDARFILALRHPCDAVLSCFMQQFGLNHAMANFLDIGDAARLYDVALNLWNHYRAILPLAVHEVRYEETVTDFRASIGALVGFLGLDWDDRLLAFDRTARGKGLTNTPSYHQVTEKIYTRASGRWMKYRAEMAPVLDILAPHAAALGYSMESGQDAA